MKFKSATASKPTKTTNDDIVGYEGNIFWLLDGATQLVAPDHGLDACWHVRRLSEELTKLARAKPSAPLVEMAKSAIAIVGSEFQQTTGLDATAPQDLRPFSTLILCRHLPEAQKLEYLLLCDSTLLVVQNGQARVVASDPRLDSMNILDECYRLLAAGHGFDSQEYKKALRHAYDIGQPKLNNRTDPQAWYAVTQDASVIDHALSGVIDFKAGDDVLLMSDGFTRAVDTLGIYKDWDALVGAVKSIGPEKIIDQIRAAERADDQGAKYQRSSRHDDATILFGR